MAQALVVGSYFVNLYANVQLVKRDIVTVVTTEFHFAKVALAIRGFHVTQVSLIITQVENKIAYHSIN